MVDFTQESKVPLGSTVITRHALNRLDQEDVMNALRRHVAGDWGDVDEDDWQENDLSLVEGLRLLSVYTDRHAVRFYVITEADRSATTVLLPEEY